MARSRRLVALGFALLVVLAGCLGGPGAPGTTTTGDDHAAGTTGTGSGTATTVETTTAAATDTPAERETTATVATGTPVEYESYVFDHYGYGSPAIEGGIQYEPGTASQFYATIVASRADAERFNRTVLDAEAQRFVDGTDFDREALVVVQAFPASSAPDYRVERTARDGDRLHLRINDSSRTGTNDVTVETVLVRVALDGQEAPTAATVTTEEGFSFEAGSVVTVRPRTTTEGPDSPDLPYASDDPDENVAEPLALRIRNAGEETNGYNVTVTYVETPECRNATPPCGQPERDVFVLRRIGKLPSGGTFVVEDAVARTGTYRVTVAASLPDGDGGRRTVLETYEWRVIEGADDLTVRITDGQVERA